DGEPGQQLNLRAVAAPNEAAAAQYYPAIYWYAMLKIPSASDFGRKDGEIPEKIKQTDWLNLMKNNGCIGCHQMGQLSTRTFPKGLGEFSTHAEAWTRRTQAGQSGVKTPISPSPYWREEMLYDTKVNNHNSMFDKKGRLWLAAAVRGTKNPDFCKQGSEHPSAKLTPLEQTHRGLAILDPKTMK